MMFWTMKNTITIISKVVESFKQKFDVDIQTSANVTDDNNEELVVDIQLDEMDLDKIMKTYGYKF